MKKLALTFIIASLGIVAQAQQDFIMYGQHDIPQSGYSNPSNRFNGNFYIGLPALSSNYFSYSNSGFAYSDLITPSGDSLLLDFENLIGKLEKDNFLAINAKIDLLSFGISLSNRTQLTVNVTENVNMRFTYPRDLVEFIYRGNGGFEGREANFSNIGFGFNHYREYGIGVSHQLTQKLRLGARAKYLYGMENIYTEKTDIRLRTDASTFEIKANADITLRTAGIDNVDSEESSSDYATGRDNTGYGIDLGAYYEFNDKISFNASILDLGVINWNSYTKSYTNEGGEFTYSGIEINAFTNGSETESGETSFDRVLDSLESAFELEESEGGYSTPLASRVYLGADYKITERDLAGVIFQSEIYQSDIRPSFTLSYSRKMTRWITLSTAYTAINRTYNNLGFGVNLNPGPVQFYIISDNILGTFQPQNTRHLQVRFGINLVFGANKSTEVRPEFRGAIGKDKGGDEESEPETESESENDEEESEN